MGFNKTELYNIIMHAVSVELEIDIRFVDITPDTTFKEIGLDSLDGIEICLILSDELSISLLPEEVDAVETINDLISILESKVDA
jgi:acyl carrier protein